MRSLEKQRDSRFASAEDFAHALENVRASIPPDQKYGLGEKMITLSGAQTLVAVTDFNGNYRITGTTEVEGLQAGSVWDLTVTSTGYAPDPLCDIDYPGT